MELLYHYLWKHRLMGKEVQTSDGESVRIIAPGRHNEDAGPDFSDARIEIGGEKWVGNVEIHVKASDWHRHGHDEDPAYDSVILHVVAINDTRIRRRDGSRIPQVTVVLPESFYLTYAALMADLKGVRCTPVLDRIPRLVREDWLETLAVERLQAKALRLLDYHSRSGYDWEQAIFIALARGLGFGLNALPFEMLAENLPLKYIYHHADNLQQIEALLFGQAGMLDGSRHIFDEYYQYLCREYAFLCRKYNLRPMREDVWKYARTRPRNFPHRRIALLAAALYGGVRFSSALVEAQGHIPSLLDAFGWEVSGYWETHTAFGSESSGVAAPKSLSDSSRELLIINVAAPFYYAHARLIGDYALGEKGINLLTELPAEKNSLISYWKDQGFEVDSALRSQALLHLRKEYCDAGRCLDCRFGHYLLRDQMIGRKAGQSQ